VSIVDSFGLPAPIVAAVALDDHISLGSDIGAATLPAPPKQVALRKLHADKIVEEAADRIWALLGQAVHVVLERAGKTEDAPFRTFREERWEIEVLGWRVAARCDHLTLEQDGTLTDYKVTSAWSVKDGAKDDWIAQLNVTAYIAEQAAGLQAAKLQVVAFLRDWRKNERLQYGEDYPERQVVVVPIPRWSKEKTRAYLEERVRLHQWAQDVATHPEGGGSLPDCTPAERWERPTTYAVKKPQNKRATRVYDRRELAEQHVASQPDLVVEVRPGVSPRCQQYCPVLPFCAQGQALVQATAAPAA